MAKYRSRFDYAQAYNGDSNGYNLGLDALIYVKREATPRVFNPPSTGTQGKSLGAVSASTDITAAAVPATLKAAVHGGAIVTASISSTVGLDTGAEIAAALETAINNALAADGQDARVWVDFNGAGPDQYTVWDQFTGTSSAVVITDGTSNNIADNLKLGVGQGGTETAGTADTDYLLYVNGGPTGEQPIDDNPHRNGRYFSPNVVRKKKVVDFDIDAHINMSGSAAASIDLAVQEMIENMLGKKTVVAGVAIDFEQALPSTYLSIVKVSTIFGEYYTGGYTKQQNLAFPGNGPATMKWTGKGSDWSEAGLAKLSTGSVASTTVTLTSANDDSKKYSVGARVMAVDTDGRTILYGADGLLLVNSYDDSLNTLVLSAAVTLSSGAFIAPWDPGAAGRTARDNIYTDLVGSFKLNAGGAAIDVTNIELSMNNDDNDLDNRFGSAVNKGRISGNRMTAELSVTFDLSGKTLGAVVRTADFTGFSPEIVLGDASSGRYLKITAPKWIPARPKKELPQNGPTPITLTGKLHESATGARDPIRMRFG